MKERLLAAYRNGRTMKLLLFAAGFGSEGVRLAWHYGRHRLFPESPDTIHLDETMQWLCRAQDVCGGNGVSAYYDLKKCWQVAYPETSGYIIATYLAYADITGDDHYIKRAIQIGDWEVAIQTPGGGILSNPQYAHVRVFNTGQVILGWCALYEQTGDQRYLEAAVRAGDYLINGQEDNGMWQKDTYCGARTYHARIDWALLRLSLLTGEGRYTEAACKNLQWVLGQQTGNGWFENCGFDNADPITHVIEYTLGGLLMSHLMDVSAVRGLNILPAIIRAADALCLAIEKHPIRGIEGMVPTSFDRNWQSADDHSCLTGNAQLAYFFFLLSRTTKNEKYRKNAESILRATKRTQNLLTSLAPLRGAIGGTYPFYKGYHFNSCPNWAAKFFADAIMMEMRYSQGLVLKA